MIGSEKVRVLIELREQACASLVETIKAHVQNRKVEAEGRIK